MSSLARFALASLLFGCAAESSADEAGESSDTDSQGDDEESLPPLEPRPSAIACTMQGTPANALPRVVAEPSAAVLAAPAFVEAVQILPDPDGVGMLVVEASGRVWRVDASGLRESQPWLDLTSEVAGSPTRGLLAIALAEGWVYAHFHRKAFPERTRVVRIPFAPATTSVDPSGALTMIELDSPADASGPSRVGGALAIDSQGNLLIGVGDVSDAADPSPWSAPAQDRGDLRGSLLRLAAPSDPVPGYAIPADNPLLADPEARPEIFAIGLHDPRYLIVGDEGTWISDSGSVREELQRLQPGANFGWPITEGWACTGPGDCDPTSYAGPSFDYGLADTDHCGLVAGAWVRGDAVPMLAGALVWTDRCSGRIWAMDPSPSAGLARSEVLGRVPAGVMAIGSDAAGDAWLIDGQGRLARLQLAEHGLPGSLPERLSASACFEASDLATPTPGLIPYLVGAPLWSDGLVKQRWMVVPPEQRIAIDEQGRWEFPEGSVLIKTFALESIPGDPSSRRSVETRFMVRRAGTWDFHTYRWRDDGSDADWLAEGQSVELEVSGPAGHETFEWQFPSEVGCRNCHGFGEGTLLGPTSLQMNRVVRYGDDSREQLDALAQLDLFAESPDPATLPRLVDPADSSADLDQRARAYLHANCAHCHQPAWMRPDLRWTTAFAETQTCDHPIEFPSPDVAGTLRIDPGAPMNSNLWLRMQTRGEGQMPLLGSGRIDATGIALIEAWILALEGCD